MSAAQSFRIPCRHWQPGNNPMAGSCRIGMYGGSPGKAVCVQLCPQYDGPPRDQQMRVALRVLVQEEFDARRMNQEISQGRSGRSSGCPGCGGKLLKKMAKGGWGQIKAALGVDAAPETLVRQRQQVCTACPSGCYDFGICRTELGGCGCVLDAKTRIKGENCPKGHW